MLIAVLSDIHGNSTALKAVLAEAARLKVSHMLILGDLVGYYYDAREVFELLSDVSKTTIKGNHENFMTGVMEGTVDPELMHKKYGSGLSIAIKTLSLDMIRQVHEMKDTEILRMDGLTIQICHGSPDSVDQYVYPDAEPAVLDKFDVAGIDYIFAGHTHYPFVRIGKHSVWANPGSVGQSRVHGGIADWAILDTARNVYIPKQTKYDTGAIKEIVKKTDPHLAYLHTILER
jgi:putative phosphoesterase